MTPTKPRPPIMSHAEYRQLQTAIAAPCHRSYQSPAGCSYCGWINPVYKAYKEAKTPTALEELAREINELTDERDHAIATMKHPVSGVMYRTLWADLVPLYMKSLDDHAALRARVEGVKAEYERLAVIVGLVAPADKARAEAFGVAARLLTEALVEK